ncbi:hypothetical protein ES703_116246 [subsurface metagenome]
MFEETIAEPEPVSEQPVTAEQPVPAEPEPKPHSFTVCGCKGTVVTTADGKKHFEIECKSKQDREEVAALFEEEAILRVNPKMVLDDEPAAAAAAPIVEPTVTRQ